MIARARATGVLALGVLALHELSYLTAGTQPSAAHAGHAYLTEAVPVVVMLATALLAVSVLAPLGGSAPGRGPRGTCSRTLLYAGLLLGAFVAQELAETIVDPASGHALSPLAGAGMLAALPLAFALGAVAALATRGLEDVEELLAAAQCDPPRARVAQPRASRPSLTPSRPAVAGASLAFGFARRPPPRALLA